MLLFYSFNDLSRIERLLKDPVRMVKRRRQDFDLFGTGDQKSEPCSGVAFVSAHPLEQLIPVLVGKSQIRYHAIEGLGSQMVKRLLTVVATGHGPAQTLQVHLNQANDVWLIITHQDPFGFHEVRRCLSHSLKISRSADSE